MEKFKNWFVQTIVLGFVAAYTIAALMDFVPTPKPILCDNFGMFCSSTYEKTCQGTLSDNSPSVDCPFTKHANKDVLFELDLANATSSTYTVVVLNKAQAKSNKNVVLPECTINSYPWEDCTAGHGRQEMKLPLASHLKEGDYVLRIVKRDNPTSFTAKIVSK